MGKFKNIYVFCPANSITGGPDALHQLTFYLNKIGCNANLVYYDIYSKKDLTIPEPYKIYVSSFLRENNVEDCCENAVILPENAVDKIKLFKYAKVFIWWLSVDNNLYRSSFFWKIYYFATLPLRVMKNYSYYKNHFREALCKTIQKTQYSFDEENSNVSHICASFYAYNFVAKKTTKRTCTCIEPISKYFLDEYKSKKHLLDDCERKNCVLFNPKKSGFFVDKIAKKAPEIEFIPLTGLNQEQLIEKYKTSKLYIDFGHFPGAERMPKEAVLFGCSIITGRKGASSVYDDVPIPDKYKFDAEDRFIPVIINAIKESLNNYPSQKEDFNIYRSTVLNLESKFIDSLKALFL